ncbi:pilus assembly protein [Eleftheria terrae]|uniref:pilus assembly protein n=1 Tax=Eleftheria terrae TaxID=1597781 RepID=UPI00263ABAF1|nr:PilC/PilY family type IV pilus protein [Eleftheria terrae]WKB52421.1 PilC/PilY family type IV pilus protein [Eleftheria terrae]
MKPTACAPQRSVFSRTVVCVTVVALQLGALTPAWAADTAPSQKPLLRREGGVPKANVMLTIDDSGSMRANHMPENTFKVNGYDVTLPYTGAARVMDVLPDDPTPLGNMTILGSVTAIRNSNSVFQRQFRSPDVNSIYYNPEVRYLPWMKPGGGRFPDAVPTSAYWNPVDTTQGTVDLTATISSSRKRWCTNPSTDAYCPTADAQVSRGLYYRLKAGTDPRVAANYVQYDINDSGPFPKAAGRTDCTGATSCTRDEERKNFANWFTFYRTRMFLTKAAISEALHGVDNTVRMGWGSINHSTVADIQGVNTSVIRMGVNDLDATQRSALLTQIQSKTFIANGSTPLRTAMDTVGVYFQRNDAKGPWSAKPGTVTGAADLSCRRAYNILMTDGYYNDSYNAAGNADNTNGDSYASSAPTGAAYTRYTAERPYKDDYSNTLADVAMKYWKKDLRPDLANKVNPQPATDEVPGGDPAYWQHLTQFTVGLGVKGTLDPKKDLLALTKGTKSWTDDEIDDLWHAAVNSRGRFFSATNSGELAKAISSALGSAAGRDGLKEAGVASAGPILQDGNRKYVPSYTSVKWTGELEAFSLDANGVAGSTPLWKASEKLPAHGLRQIYTWDAVNKKVVPFTWAGMPDATRKLIGTDVSESLVNYLRGDTSNEGTETTNFRIRAGKLPDFVNSPPSLVGGNVDMFYETLPIGGKTYREYVDAKKKRDPVIFLGGNGGMLHAFRDTLVTPAPANAGTEVFAYVPNAVLPNLSKLSKKDYGTAANYHQFFVDGPLTEADAYLNGSWTNVLVGTLGAGGKGLFALRLDKDNIAANLNASSVMWELSSANDADIGYMNGDAQIGVLADGSWKVFIGNGSFSTNGRAVLLVIDLATGAISKLIAGTAGGNGLGGVRLIKDAKQQVIGVYAGDLQGNLWRFDFGTGVSTDWKVGLGGRPLFTASSGGVAQPITSSPSYVPHEQNGNVVLFATGKLSTEGDPDDKTVQAVYGVWDRTKAGETSALTAAVTRDQLVEQRILGSKIDPLTKRTYYEVTSNDVDWKDKSGWFMNFSIEQRQRSIYPPVVIGDFVYISTIVPAAAAGECEATEGKGFNFLMPAHEGGQYTKAPVLDTNGDGVLNSSDLNAAGFITRPDGRGVVLTKKPVRPGGTGEPANGADKETDVSLQNSGGAAGTDPLGEQDGKVYCIINCKPPNTNKVISERVWRRIINPPIK